MPQKPPLKSPISTDSPPPLLGRVILSLIFLFIDAMTPIQEVDSAIRVTPSKANKPFRSHSSSSPKTKQHLSVPKAVPIGALSRGNGATSKHVNNVVKHPTLNSAEIDKSLLRDKRAMFYKTSMSDKGVDVVDVDFPGCCPLIRVFKKTFWYRTKIARTETCYCIDCQIKDLVTGNYGSNCEDCKFNGIVPDRILRKRWNQNVILILRKKYWIRK